MGWADNVRGPNATHTEYGGNGGIIQRMPRRVKRDRDGLIYRMTSGVDASRDASKGTLSASEKALVVRQTLMRPDLTSVPLAKVKPNEWGWTEQQLREDLRVQTNRYSDAVDGMSDQVG